MQDDLNPGAEPGEEEVVSVEDTQASETTETVDNDASQESGESTDDNAEETLTRSQARKKRRREHDAKIRQELTDAERRLNEATERQERITRAGESAVEPVEKDFDDYTEYVAAKAVWKHVRQTTERDADEARTETEKARELTQAIRDRERRLAEQSFTEQVKDARARYTDFDEVITDPDLRITDKMRDIIVSSDSGADVAYHLGRNKALALEISQMSQVDAARMIGHIEAKLSAPASRTETNAPDPITPVKGKASASKDPTKMTFAEYKKWRAAG